MIRIPEKGLDRETLFSELDFYRKDDVPWRGGRVFTIGFDAGREAEAIGREALAQCAHDNALDPTEIPSAHRFETEVVGMALSHLGAGPDAVGNFTSGGTESIMLAVKSARELAGRARPNLVLPVTGHAAFRKAAHYLGLEVIEVDVDPLTLRADVEATARAITPDTVLLVGSAPCWPYGVIDPIPELGRLALERGIPFHVDACVGGFLLPYFRRLGAVHTDFDFRVPGVTSLSADLHKFAFAPKGASVILYRDKDLRRRQMYSCVDWPGYTIINPTVQSSKSVGPMAGAWAVMRYLGDDGYLEMARRTLSGIRRLTEGVASIPGLEILGRPDFALAAAASRGPSVFSIADEMQSRGWKLMVQVGFRRHPANLHFLITPGNSLHVDALLADLAEAAKAAPAPAPSDTDLAAAVGDLLGSEGLTPDTARQLLALAGISGPRLPEKMSDVYALLDSLPRPLVRQLVTEYFNDLYSQPEASFTATK